MKKILFLFATVGALAFLIPSPSPWAAKEPGLKRLMGENFQNVQLILSDLMTSNYGSLPEKISSINSHAIDLGKNPPDFLKDNYSRRLFSDYASGLQYQSGNMLTVLKELIQHDQQRSQPGKMNVDYLRVVAARHFGEIVTSCVLCHNQFRRHMVGQ